VGTRKRILSRYDLRNKVVLITGASGGIGRAAAVEFHRAGARVVAVARSLDKLETLAAELGGDRVAVLKADITMLAERQSALSFARSRFGHIDVLVNNAGWASFGTVQNLPREHLERMTALNFLAPIALIQAVLPEMLARRSGQIINVSSIVGTQPIPRMTVYSATKSALDALTTGLRMELHGSGVDVLLVAPGSTNTDFFNVAATIDAKATRFADAQYTPQRVARCIVQSSRRRRREVTLSAEARLISLIRRFSRRAADGIMRRVAKRAMPEITKI